MRDTSSSLGTLLRRLVDLLDSDLERVYAAMSLDYRPRYTPVYRVLLSRGAATIGDIAQQACVSHSAASQTVAHMASHGLVKQSDGPDRRQRLTKLTKKGLSLRSRVENQWEVTTQAAEHLDRELSMPLSTLLKEAISALEKQSFSNRIDAIREIALTKEAAS